MFAWSQGTLSWNLEKEQQSLEVKKKRFIKINLYQV